MACADLLLCDHLPVRLPSALSSPRSGSGRSDWMESAPHFTLSQSQGDTASNSTTCPSNISTSRENSLHRQDANYLQRQRQLTTHARRLQKFINSTKRQHPLFPTRKIPTEPYTPVPLPTQRLPHHECENHGGNARRLFRTFDVAALSDRLLAMEADHSPVAQSSCIPPPPSTYGLVNPQTLNFHLQLRPSERPCDSQRRRKAIMRTLDFFEAPRCEASEGLGVARETHKLHHMILTWNGPAELVEVCGSFSPHPWADVYPLWWCPTNRLHWIDLHETVVPDLSGIVQFKFIVDGVWKCDPAYPICDDGSVQHNLNNVSMIFPHRLRLRLSFEKLRKHQQLSVKSSPAPSSATSVLQLPKADPKHLFIPLLTTEQGLVNQPTWACRPSSPSALTTPATLSSHRAALKSRWRLASETRGFAQGDAEKRHHPTTDSDSARNEFGPPLISGEGPNCSRTCRRCMRTQSKRRRKRVGSTDRLSRCLSHHGGRLSLASSTPLAFQGAVPSRLFELPSRVTELLHSPDVLLALRLPTNVLKMRGNDLSVSAGWAMTPHPEKVATGGADAFYVSPKQDCLALADGVGEWDSLGFCPREFADDLMTGIADIWENQDHPIHALRQRLPPSLIAQELMKLASKKPKTYGSATCCIAIFDEKRQQIGVCNLGDSGCCIMRRNDKCQMTCLFKTETMSHFFNCPYQLSLSPPSGVLTKIFGVTKVENGKGLLLPSEDEPKHAKTYDVPVEEGDLVLLASDGLWDNLWQSEISSVAQLALAPFEGLILHDSSLGTAPDQIARAVTEAAAYRSRDRRCCTPFAKSYTDECGVAAFAGGKWDDITVVAGWISRGGEIGQSERAAAAKQEEDDILSVKRASWSGLSRWPYRPHSSNDLSAADSDCDFLGSERHGHGRRARKRVSHERRLTDV